MLQLDIYTTSKFSPKHQNRLYQNLSDNGQGPVKQQGNECTILNKDTYTPQK